MNRNNRRLLMSIREAVVDTAWAFSINTPLNFMVIAYSFNQGWSATKTSVILTLAFTLIGIVRKTIIRLRFHAKYGL